MSRPRPSRSIATRMSTSGSSTSRITRSSPNWASCSRWRSASSQASRAVGAGSAAAPLLAELELAVSRRVRGVVPYRNARIRRELLQDVRAPRRIDQVGADHRVVLELDAPGPGVASRPWRPVPPSDLASCATSGRPSRPPASAARSAASPVTARSPSVAAQRPSSIDSAIGPRRGRRAPRLGRRPRSSRRPSGSAPSPSYSSSSRWITARSSNSAAKSRSRERSGSGRSRRRGPPRHVDVQLHRRELLRDPRVVRVLGQVLLALRARDLVDRLEHLLERAELLQELGRGLVADPGDAGDVVRGIALEADQVGHQLRRHAVALDHSFGVVDLGVGDAA